MKIPYWLPPAVSVLVLFGSVGAATLNGTWITGGHVDIVQGRRLSVDDLKGWMTLQEASDGLGLPLARIIDLIGPPRGSILTGATAFRDVEALVPGFQLSSFRDKLRGLG